MLVRETGHALLRKSGILTAQPFRTSRLQTVHRTVSLTLLTLLGFKSLQTMFIQKNTRPPKGVRIFLVRETGLEPVRGLPTRPSNVRVCRFRHSRSTKDIIADNIFVVNTFCQKISKSLCLNL